MFWVRAIMRKTVSKASTLGRVDSFRGRTSVVGRMGLLWSARRSFRAETNWRWVLLECLKRCAER